MSNKINFYIHSSKKDLCIRLVLLEKIHYQEKGVNFCCFINDIPIYSDLSIGYRRIRIYPPEQKINFIVVGCENEQIKNDSTILQNLAQIINHISL